MARLYNLAGRLTRGLPGMLLVLLVSNNVLAGSDDVVDGDIGILYVSGTLAQGACNVESDTFQQSVDLGTISSSELLYPGDRGKGKAFHLHLRDCFDSEVTEQPTRTGNIAIGDGLPFARVSFMGAGDPDNSALLAVHGAGGFGLRLEDQWHQAVHLNAPGDPIRVASGNPVLTYYLLPERTHAPLKEGAWQVVVYIGLNYD